LTTASHSGPPVRGSCKRSTHYRLEAEDRSGNASRLSEWAAAITADRIAPAPPRWTLSPAWSCPGGEAEIFVRWETPDGAVESRLLRRAAGGDFFVGLTGWLTAGEEHRYPVAGDEVDPELGYTYRLEARDQAGNVSRLDTAVAPRPDICGAGARYVRGDPNCDGRPDISDAIHILGVLFRGDRPAAACFGGVGAGGGGVPGPFACNDAADINADGTTDLSDAVLLLAHLFRGGPAPAAPYPACGRAVGKSLGCAAHLCGT